MPTAQYGPGRGRADISALAPRGPEQFRMPSKQDQDLRKQCEGRLIGLRVNRYSWWVHWRECADYQLPRRYKWIITPNQMSRGSPINQHILDSTATLAARNLAAGMMTGCTDPTKRWFRLRIGMDMDTAETTPTTLWLWQVENILYRIFQESNFYPAMGTMYFDLVVFGTATFIIYEDFDHVIRCFNPCLGEFYLDNDQSFWPAVLYREFTLTIDQTVREFGIENVSPAVARLYKEGGASLTRELVIAHAIEPNDDGRKFGIPFGKYREVYWEWAGSASPQGGASYSPGILRKRGFHEQPHVAVRWDLVSNDPYGRCPGMDALPDVKQLQLEVKRKAQAIDKMVNPPMVADIQLKNAPASLLPGGITYIAGMVSQGRPGFSPVYTVNPNLADMKEDLIEVRERIKETYYNNLFQTISQYETRSNVTAAEIDARRSESMVMLGPVLERLVFEGFKPIIERVFAIASRAGILPPAPDEIKGSPIDVDFVSMLELAQDAAQMAGIERVLQMVGNLEGVKPDAIDVVDTDYGIMKASSLLHNDPKLIRSKRDLAALRQQRQQAQQAQQMSDASDSAQKLSAGAKTLSETDVGGGQNALQSMLGGLGG